MRNTFFYFCLLVVFIRAQDDELDAVLQLLDLTKDDLDNLEKFLEDEEDVKLFPNSKLNSKPITASPASNSPLVFSSVYERNLRKEEIKPKESPTQQIDQLLESIFEEYQEKYKEAETIEASEEIINLQQDNLEIQKYLYVLGGISVLGLLTIGYNLATKKRDILE